MKVAITGHSKLAKNIGDTLTATPHAGQPFIVKHIRMEDILMNGTNMWFFDKENPNHVDAIINNGHQDFDQTKILEKIHNAWLNDSSKYIINISSRASQPNISKGYLYSAQKASLNQLANNLTYNSKKQYKMTTINLGLLEDERVPSVPYHVVSGVIHKLLTSWPDLEVSELTLQAHANYQEVQSDKEMYRDLDQYLT